MQYAASWNQSEQTNSPALDQQQSRERELRQADHAGLRRHLPTAPSSCAPVTNPFGPVGSPSANAPPIQFSVRARYEWAMADYNWFVQAGATHDGHSFTQAGSNPTILPGGAINTSRGRFEIPAYSVYNASFGVAKDPWSVNVFCENLSNSNASTFISTDQFIVEQTPLRPRVIGGSFGYKF